MMWRDYLDIGAGVAAIATSVIAVVAYSYYRFGSWQRRRRVVAKLHEVAAQHPDPQTVMLQEVSVLLLMADLGMTEAQVLEAAFGNKYIIATPRGGASEPAASSIFLRYIHPPSKVHYSKS